MHDGHDVSLYLTDVTLEVSVSINDFGNLVMVDTPTIMEAGGDETVYCNTCKREVTIEVREDWEFV